MAEPDNIVLTMLRCMDSKLDRIVDDIGDSKVRVGIPQQQYASMSNRIDRIEMRLDRIKRRLDLVDAS